MASDGAYGRLATPSRAGAPAPARARPRPPCRSRRAAPAWRRTARAATRRARRAAGGRGRATGGSRRRCAGRGARPAWPSRRSDRRSGLQRRVRFYMYMQRDPCRVFVLGGADIKLCTRWLAHGPTISVRLPRGVDTRQCSVPRRDTCAAESKTPKPRTPHAAAAVDTLLQYRPERSSCIDNSFVVHAACLMAGLEL